MKINTKLTKVTRNVKKQKGFINPGIYKGSTMIFNNFEDYISDIKNDDDRSTLYGINKNPSVEQLEKAISSLYKCQDTIVTSSGLAALVIPFFSFLKKNDEVLINDTVYSPTRTFCEKILKNYGVKVKYFHPFKDIDNFEKLINIKTKLIYLESPGTATFEILDIPKITTIAKRKKIPTVLDNTWASPLFCDPIKLGVNIIIDAGTKYINGHSDILIGFVSSDKKYSKNIRITSKTLGMCPGSEEVYLALRGLPTLNLRMKQIEANALKLARELEKHPLVDKVYHPALERSENHYIWKRDFRGSSGLFAFSFKKFYSQNKIKKMFLKISIFKLGYSWGGYDSLITFPPLSKRKFKTKIKGNLIRIYCGLEDSKDQINDITNSLKALN
ncbi:PLP-dependent aspartate aminotransferase family protein [Alphaproteobacteria bacterium]|nr:PLP-dependent aspartate aminotransferase family protein [Alphaproteobacteria bacterium]